MGNRTAGREMTAITLVTALERDPRLRSAPLDVRGVWLLTCRELQRQPTRALPIKSMRSLAFRLGISAAGLGERIDELIARGLLVHAGNTLASPLLRPLVVSRDGKWAGRTASKRNRPDPSLSPHVDSTRSV